MIGYIYILKCPTDNSIRYVGLTINPKKRKLQHRAYLNSSSNIFYENWKKYLKSLNFRPIFEIIEETTTEEMSHREIYWIKYYKSIGCDLTNLTEGGEYNMISENHNSKFLKGRKFEDYYGEERSREIRSRMGSIGEKNPNYKGATCTKEWKEKQAKSQSKVPLLVYENEILIGEFANSKDVAKFLKCGNSNIRMSKKYGWLVKRKYKIIDKI